VKEIIPRDRVDKCNLIYLQSTALFTLPLHKSSRQLSIYKKNLDGFGQWSISKEEAGSMPSCAMGQSNVQMDGGTIYNMNSEELTMKIQVPIWD
jgi:hypothetical protein